MKKTISFVLTCVMIFGIFSGISVSGASESEIELTFIPEQGQPGSVTGRVLLDGLTPYSDYGIIAVLYVNSGAQYAKPTYADYITNLTVSGTENWYNFSVNINSAASDYQHDNFILYLVKKSDFIGVSGSAINDSYMTGKYIIRMEVKKSAQIPAPSPSMPAGFVSADTKISFDVSGDRGNIYYTLDCSSPLNSSSRMIYTDNQKFTITGTTIIKICHVLNGKPSVIKTYTYMIQDDWSKKPFSMLNFSPNITESFTAELSRETIQKRLNAVVPLTSWIRTFDTANTGLQYVNYEAHARGLKIIQGIHLVEERTQADININTSKINALKQILKEDKKPDIICLSNELSLAISDSGQRKSLLLKYINIVRGILKDENLDGKIPLGIAETYGGEIDPEVFAAIDISLVNIYAGVWDNTSVENGVSKGLELYDTARLTGKMTIISEMGAPYDGQAYSVDYGSKPKPTVQSAVTYLNKFLHLTQGIPAAYFQAYTQTAKTSHPIEKYFGLMGQDLELFPFYEGLIDDFMNKQLYTVYNDSGNALVSSHTLEKTENVVIVFDYFNGTKRVKTNFLYTDLENYETILLSDPDKPLFGYDTVNIYGITEIIKGDINDDGKVNIADIICLSRHVTNTDEIINPVLLNAADVNGDYEVNISDLVRLARWYAEIDKTPLGKPSP